MLKNKKGITLIALIITIIVLLILAGVALATLTGQGNIIKNAQNAVGKYNNSVIAEQELLNLINSYFSKNTTNNGRIVVLDRKESEISVKVENSKLVSYQFSIDGKNWSEEQGSPEYIFKDLEKVYVDGRGYTWSDENVEIKTGNKYIIYVKGKDTEGNNIELEPIETSNVVEVRESGINDIVPEWIQYEELENEIIITGIDANTYIANITATNLEDWTIYPGYNLNSHNTVEITIPSYINEKPVTKISQKVIETTIEPKLNSGMYNIYLLDEGNHILGSYEGKFSALRFNDEAETGGKGLPYVKDIRLSPGTYKFLVIGENWVGYKDIDIINEESITIGIDVTMFNYDLILPPTIKEIVPYEDIVYEVVEDETGEGINIGVTVPNYEEEWREGNIKILGKDSLDEIINGNILKEYPSKDCTFYN